MTEIGSDYVIVKFGDYDSEAEKRYAYLDHNLTIALNHFRDKIKELEDKVARLERIEYESQDHSDD